MHSAHPIYSIYFLGIAVGMYISLNIVLQPSFSGFPVTFSELNPYSSHCETRTWLNSIRKSWLSLLRMYCSRKNALELNISIVVWSLGSDTICNLCTPPPFVLDDIILEFMAHGMFETWICLADYLSWRFKKWKQKKNWFRPDSKYFRAQ